MRENPDDVAPFILLAWTGLAVNMAEPMNAPHKLATRVARRSAIQRRRTQLELSSVQCWSVMAEAAVESPVGQFYCHKCSQEISPLLPDYVCPRCQLGFIEQVEHQNSPQESPNDDLEDNVPPSLSEVFNIIEGFQPLFMPGESSREFEDGPNPLALPGGPSARNTARRARPDNSHQALRTRAAASRRLSSTDRNIDGFLHHVMATITGTGGGVRGNAGIPIFFNLHGNPGDYVWGRGGLDAVITQLLNQFDGTGPPPLPKEKIKDIPSVNITQEQVSKILQCTVCMEDFKLNEPVKRLSCSHHFHQGCIIPWLELHGTCPICRKLLDDEENGRGPSDVSGGTSNRVRQGSNSGNTATSSHPSNSVYDFDDDYE